MNSGSGSLESVRWRGGISEQLVPDSEVAMREYSSRAEDLTVVWTRGKGCAELADLLAFNETNRIVGDVDDACISQRADLLVSKRLPGDFDLVSVAVPVDFQPKKVTSVVATVAGGPHSLLAAETAAQLGRSLGVPT